MTSEVRKKEETNKSEGCGPMSSGIFEMMRKYCDGEVASSNCAAMLSRMGGMPCCGPDRGKAEPEGGNNERTE